MSELTVTLGTNNHDYFLKNEALIAEKKKSLNENPHEEVEKKNNSKKKERYIYEHLHVK